MILGFKHFHPLRGVLPDTFPEFGGDIVYRARTLLDKRSDEEIFAAIEIINWIIDESPAREEALAALEKGLSSASDRANETDEGNINDSSIRRDLYSSTYALKARQAKYDITGDERLPNASWAEMFAALALSLIDQAFEDEVRYGNKALTGAGIDSDWFYEYRAVSHASYWLIEAMDAIGTAEGIRYLESVVTESKQKVRVRTQQAAIRRHAKTNDALTAFRDFYISEKHKSMRNAAQIFCEKFPKMAEHLAPYNRVRTLTEGLSKLLKGKRLSLQ
jgi:hypothetical protein